MIAELTLLGFLTAITCSIKQTVTIKYQKAVIIEQRRRRLLEKDMLEKEAKQRSGVRDGLQGTVLTESQDKTSQHVGRPPAPRAPASARGALPGVALASPVIPGDYLRFQEGRQFYNKMANIPKIMTTGAAPTYAEWFADSEEARMYTEAQHNGSLATAKQLLRKLDLSGVRDFLDVGGGSGAFSIALCRTNPETRAQVIELPEVAKTGMGFVSKEDPAVAGRIQYISGTALDSWPLPDQSQDCVLMSYLSGSVPEGMLVSLFTEANRVLRPGGRLLVRDFMVADLLNGPAGAVNWALAHVSVNAKGLLHELTPGHKVGEIVKGDHVADAVRIAAQCAAGAEELQRQLSLAQQGAAAADELRQQLAAAQLQGASVQEELQRELAAAQQGAAAAEELREQLAAAQRVAAEREELRAELAAQREEAAAAAGQRHAEAERVASEAAELRERLAEAEQKSARLSGELDAASDALRGREAELAELRHSAQEDAIRTAETLVRQEAAAAALRDSKLWPFSISVILLLLLFAASAAFMRERHLRKKQERDESAFARRTMMIAIAEVTDTQALIDELLEG